MTIEQLYKNYRQMDTRDGANARAWLEQMHWYSTMVKLDPRTGEALPQALSEVLDKYVRIDKTYFKDRVWRIIEHARASLEKLYHDLNESPRREHAVMPLRAVRELDTSSFMALSRRPGRTIREKLAEKPYLQAVQRVQSIDLPENRLLKAFSERLAELLELRYECLKEEGANELWDLLTAIRSWLMSDEAKAIGRWENLPPNNTLLSHRHYRAIYDSWRWLQSLNDDISLDLEKLNERRKMMKQWFEMGEKYRKQKYLFAEMPVLFDYEAFELHPWTKSFVCYSGSVKRPVTSPQITSPACIDLTDLYPQYSYLDKSDEIKQAYLPYSLLWQNWYDKDNDISVDINLFNADAAYLHPDATLISSTDLFFSTSHTDEHLDRAARSFAKKLSKIFSSSKTFVWLQPDSLNDFELEITRRNINAIFPKAEPLPRSIAAVFEKIQFSRIWNFFTVIVVDEVGGKRCATKLVAKYDKELNEELPETYGFYWERHPSIILGAEEQTNTNKSNDIEDFVFVDEQGKWHCAQNKRHNITISKAQLQQDERIGKFDMIISIDHSPVEGGIKLYNWQRELKRKNTDIHLWRDYLPELAMRVPFNGVPTRFSLVENISILPVRGEKTSIDIFKLFSLKQDEKDYHFPLIKGNGTEEFHYTVYLHSKDFPLRQETTCQLQLTYEYGADAPYQLRFISKEPVNGKKLDIIAEWQKDMDDYIPNAFSYPTFPAAPSWQDIIHAEENYSCFTPKWWNEFEQVCKEWKEFQLPFEERKIERIRLKNYNKYKGFGFSESVTGKDVFCYYTKFTQETFDKWINWQEVYAMIEQNQKGYYAKIIALSIEDIRNSFKAYAEEQINKRSELFSRKKRSLRFQLYTLLGGLREFNKINGDSNLIENFFSSINKLTEILLEKLQSPQTYPEIKRNIIMFFAFLHKYAPQEYGERLCKYIQTNDWKYYVTEFGYAIGDCTCKWQQTLWEITTSLKKITAIKIMNIALWRYPNLIKSFSYENADRYLNQLLDIMQHNTNPEVLTDDIKEFIENFEKIKAQRYNHQTENNQDSQSQNQIGNISYTQNYRFCKELTIQLEFLLIMLHLRGSSDEKIRRLLYPTHKRTSEFLKILNNISNINLGKFSRIKTEISKPKDAQHICDLIFALRYYLSGTDTSCGIKILEVSNEQETE